MTNKDLDKLVAERIELKTRMNNVDILFYQYGTGLYREFTLNDARCREIAREYFRIATSLYYTEKGWSCSTATTRGVFGKTIAEAEIACIRAIMGAE